MRTAVDVIVIGAGSAGCVVAARLSASQSVLLLEAGPDLRPGGLPDELRYLSRPIREPYNWGDTVDSVGRTLNYARGRVVGGSSATNGAVAMRPEIADFASWPEGWGWDDMLPYLNTIERDADFGAAAYHGDAGPLPIVRYPEDEWTEFQRAFVDGCLKVGMPYCPDHNAPGTTGVGPIPMNREGQRRVSNAAAFLEPARDRITVRGDSFVKRLLLEGGRVVGVELADEFVYADRVVLCGGVVQNPLLLRRSGVSLPALGRSLTDHMVVSYAVPIRPDTVPDGAPTLQTIARASSEVPHDLQLTPVARRHADGRRELDVSVSLQIPAGSGSVTAEGGIVWPFAGIEENVRRLRDGWRLAARIADASGIALEPLPVVGDAELDALIAKTHYAFYHGVGTCRMGPGGVVDGELKVHGVEGLHIVDASVVPVVPRSNTNLLVTALAEKWSATVGGV